MIYATKLTAETRAKFEQSARMMGHRNFDRRSHLYCVSELNTLAAGFCMAMESMVAQQATQMASIAHMPIMAQPQQNMVGATENQICRIIG